MLKRLKTIEKSIAGCIVALFLSSNSGAWPLFGAQQKHPVNVTDSIGMRMVADDSYYDGYSLVGPVAQFSPDGSKFVVVLRSGNLRRNTNDYSVFLWRTSELRQSVAPQKILTMSSSSNRDAIAQVRWLADSDTLAFLGELRGGRQQVFTYNIRARTLRQLTNHRTNILSFSMTGDGNEIAFVAEATRKDIVAEKYGDTGFSVSTQTLTSLLFWRDFQGNPELYVQRSGHSPHRLQVDHAAPWSGDAPYLSPNGEFIVSAVRVSEVPATWKEYSQTQLKEFASARIPPGQYSPLRRYVLIDTMTGDNRILLDSPLSTIEVSHVVWLPDSRSLVMSGVYLPLERTSREERTIRQNNPFAVEINIPSGEIEKISQKDLTLLDWDSKTNLLVFEVGSETMKPQPAKKAYFRWSGRTWEEVTELSADPTRPDVTLAEDPNTPPKIFFRESVKEQRKVLMDLNPQFRELEFASVEQIQWKGSDGHSVDGGLYYPVGYVPGERYPLVIQTHGWNPRRFWIDGAFPSGFVAQELAGKGIMVLQASEDYEGMYAFASVEREVAALKGAVDYLAAKGLIDPRRVGIIGFSITGLYIKYALSHEEYPFAAASVADDVDGGYLNYLALDARAFETTNGGLPFGDGLKMWMKRNPAFNADKVETPLRILAVNRGSLLNEWEWFAALRRLGKPVDLVYMEDGVHVLEKPRDRVISQQGNIDWFCFWLKGEEDPDPAKADQYARWRELRKLQQRNQGTAPTN